MLFLGRGLSGTWSTRRDRPEVVSHRIAGWMKRMIIIILFTIIAPKNTHYDRRDANGSQLAKSAGDE